MKIGLDARSLMMPRPRGTGRNLLDVYRVLPRLRPAWDFVLYHQRPVPDNIPDPPWQHDNVALRRIDMPGDRLDAWFQLRLPLATRQDGLDLLHCPANAAPAWCPVPVVSTIHDLVPLLIEDELPPALTRRFRTGILRAIRRSVALITPSAATRNDLRRCFKVPEDRVTVVPWAADTAMLAQRTAPLSAERRSELQRTYNLRQRWLVTFAGSSRRKNARGVLDAFARVSPDLRRDVQVVLVGAEPSGYREALAATAERLGISDRCRILSFVPYEDLPDLLRYAAGLLIPSRCEGFGLPVLDAFAAGIPVLASNVSSLPEVGGDAAVYCNPNDSNDIAAGIARLLDPATAQDLIQRGGARLRQFTWQRTAEALGRAYGHCLDRVLAARGPMLLGSPSR